MKADGLRGFYKGLSAPLGAQALYKSVIFATNAKMRSWIGDSGGGLGVFICGAASGFVNSAVVSPVELIRAKLMLQSSASVPGDVKPAIVRLSPVGVVRDIVSKQGVLGLWHGYRPTVLRDGPGMGFFFLLFELSKRALAPADGSPVPLSSMLLAGSAAGIGYALPRHPDIHQCRRSRALLFTVLLSGFGRGHCLLIR